MPALYEVYLKWYHDRAPRRWATFEPTQQYVDIGDYGWFGDNLFFNTAPDQKIKEAFDIPVKVTDGGYVGPSLLLYAKDFCIRINGGTAIALPLHSPLVLKAGAKISFHAKNEHWFALQVRKATQAMMTNPSEVQMRIREEYLAGRWELDDYVVTENVRCSDGFAILGEEKGAGFAVTVDADVKIGNVSELANVRLAPECRGIQFAYESYPFDDDSDTTPKYSTPTFRAPIGISRARWAKLLGMKKFGTKLVGANNRKWPIRKTPLNLRHLPQEQRLYQPGAEGVLSPDEIRAIPLDRFFEYFETLDQVFIADQEARGEEQERAH
jgi:hypothetical protein